MKNQDILAESLKKVDPEELAAYIEMCGCENCPAFSYCDEYFKFDDGGINRVPDKDGNILDCEDILVKWLKEDDDDVET